MNRGKGTSQKGQSLVELVLVLPVLLVILAGLLDLGRLYYAYVAVTDASGEGAAYGATHPDDVGGITTRATQATSGLIQIDEDQVDVEQSANTIKVTVEYTFSLITPLLHAIVPDGEIPLRAVTSETILAGEID